MSVRNGARRHILPFLFFASVFLLALIKIGDTDAWMHLVLGKIIWLTKGLPATEQFVYPSLELPFNYSSWLFGLTWYLIYLAGGHHGVVLFKALIAAGAFSLLYRDAMRPFRNHVVTLLVLATVVLMVRHRFVERPDLFAMVFLPFSIWSLNSYLIENRKAYLYPLPLVHLLWANSHSSVVLMCIPFLSFIVGGSLERVLVRQGVPFFSAPSWRQIGMTALFLAISFAVSLIGPYGLGQYSFGAAALTDAHLKWTISELQPVFWGMTRWPYLFSAAVVLSFVLNWRRFSLSQALLVLPFIVLPFQAFRFVFFLGIVGGPVLARNLSSWVSGRSWRELLTGRFAGTAVAVWILASTVLALNNTFTVASVRRTPGFGIEDGAVPEGALAFMDRNGVRGRVFNAFQWGGYIAWRDFPDRSVFVDPRGYLPAGLLSQMDLVQDHPAVLEGLESRYGFNAVLITYDTVPPDEQSDNDAAGRALMHPRWALVYWDDLSLLYLKRGGHYDELVRKHEYTAVVPEKPISRARVQDVRYREQVLRDLTRNLEETGSARALILLAAVQRETGRTQDALDSYQRVLRHPLADRPAAYRGLSALYERLGSPADALKYHQKALSSEDDVIRLFKIGKQYASLQDPGKASEYLEKALGKNPDFIPAFPLLASLYWQQGRPEKAASLLNRYRPFIPPRAGEENFRAGLAAYAQRQYAGALAELQKALVKDPSNPVIYSNMGYVYLDTGALAKAREYQLMAISLDPRYANAYYGLALVHKKEGDMKAARQNWEKYLTMAPEGDFSRRARQEIEALGRHP